MTDEVMTAVTIPDAARMAEIHALRQLTDSIVTQTRQFGEAMGSQTRALEKVIEKVDDVRERVIRLEEQKHGDAIEELKAELKTALARVDALESRSDKLSGGAAVGAWLAKNWASITAFAGAVGLVAYDKLKTGG